MRASGAKARIKACRLPKRRLASFCLVATGNSIGHRQKKMRAPCGAEGKCGWAGMYRPSIA